MSKTTLEKRIHVTLNNHDTLTANEVADLIAETRSAIVATERAAEAERKAAYNLASPDRAKARAALAAAEFTLTCLRNALPNLEARYQQLCAVEADAAWIPEFEKADMEGVKLDRAFAEFYAQVAERLADFDERFKAVNRERAAVMSRKPQTSRSDIRTLSALRGSQVLRGVARTG